MHRISKKITFLLIVILLSITIFSIILYSISLTVDLNIYHAQVIFIVAILLSFLLERKLNISTNLKTDYNVIIAFLLCSTPYWFYFANNDNFNSSYHFDYHYGYVTQILNSHIPPTNVYGLGLPTTTYWCYHALIAVFVDFTKIPIEYAFQVINIFSLFLVLIISNSIIILFKPNLKLRFLWILFIPFGLNILGGVIFLGKILVNGSELINTNNIYENFDYLGVSYDIPLQYKTLYNKFMVFNSVPLAFSLFLLNFHLLLTKYKTGVLVVLALSSCFLIHPTLSILPAIFSAIYILNNIVFKKEINTRSILDLSLFCLINVVYIIFIDNGRKSFGESNISIDLINYTSWISFLNVILPTIILLVVLHFYSKKTKLSITYLYAIIALIFSLSLSIKIENQYKFTHQLVIILSILIIQFFNNNLKSKIIQTIISLGFLSKLVIVQYLYSDNFKFGEYQFKSIDNEIVSKYDSVSQISYWLKKEDEKHDILLIIPPSTKKITPFTTCGNIDLYARKYWIFTDSKEFQDRFDICNILYYSSDLKEKENIFNQLKKQFSGMEVVIYVSENVKETTFSDNFIKIADFKPGKFYQLK